MNNRSRVQFFYICLLPFCMGSCKEKLPDRPTVVKGKVKDENGKPFGGAIISFYGIDQVGLSGKSTFHLQVKTNVSGDYSISKVIPNGTDQVETFAEFEDSLSTGSYQVFFDQSGKYTLVGSPYNIRRNEWGSTTFVNYQIRKK